jgi:hypothetical protein
MQNKGAKKNQNTKILVASALLSFVARVNFVDYKNFTFAANNLARCMAILKRFQRAFNFHL